MDDRSGFFQRQAESQVWLPKAVRVALAVVVLLGATFFILTAVTLFATDRSKMPSPMGALLMMLFLIALGTAFAYIALRLLLVRKQTDYLLSPKGGRIASYCVAALGAAAVVGGVFVMTLDFGVGLFGFVAAWFAFPMAYWLYRSTKRAQGDG